MAVAVNTATAQPEIPAPIKKWAASHFLSPNAAVTDEGVDTVFWHDPATTERWVYVTGYVTDAAYGNATRMVTLKYPADAPGPTPPVPAAVRYFPPEGQPVSGTNKAVAMTVNPLTGDIYVVGEARNPEAGTHQDYVLIKYTPNLAPDPEWGAEPPYNLDGVRHYDNGINGHDRPTDVILSAEQTYVLVTGTSAGLGTGDDIATVAWEVVDGERAAAWPNLGHGTGVRRFNNALVNGNDRGVELGGAVINCGLGDDCVIDVVVLGTSYGGAVARDDILVLNYGPPLGDVRWSRRYDNPSHGDDVATGLTVDWAFGETSVFVCGHTPHVPPPTSAAGFAAMSSSAALQRDYIVLSFVDRLSNTNPGVPNPGWADQGLGVGVRHYDKFGQDDFAADIQWSPLEGTRLWVTGRVRNGIAFDTWTLKLDAAIGSTVCDPVFATNADAEDQPANFAPTEFYWGRDQNAYITGFSTVATGLPERFATLRYDLNGAPCQLKWLGLYDTPGGSAVGRAATTEDPPDGFAQTDVWVAGRGYSSVTGQDIILIRYAQPQ